MMKRRLGKEKGVGEKEGREGGGEGRKKEGGTVRDAGMVIHLYNASTWNSEAGRLRVRG